MKTSELGGVGSAGEVRHPSKMTREPVRKGLRALMKHGSSLARCVGCLCTVLGVTVDVLNQDGLTESWFVVQSRTAISMTTSSNFEIKGAVDLVFFCTKNRRKILRHLERSNSDANLPSTSSQARTRFYL